MLSSGFNAVVAQPAPMSSSLQGNIRIQLQTPGDSDFVARTLVDGFESKFVHAVGRQKYVTNVKHTYGLSFLDKPTSLLHKNTQVV